MNKEVNEIIKKLIVEKLFNNQLKKTEKSGQEYKN